MYSSQVHNLGIEVTANVYTVTNITAGHMINVTFKPKDTGGGNQTHTITASAGKNGTISPNGAVVVNDGADQTFNGSIHVGSTC
jgi:hypothetical protein